MVQQRVGIGVLDVTPRWSRNGMDHGQKRSKNENVRKLNVKSKNKSKKPKRRIPVAPPGKRHKSVKDYDRKKDKSLSEDGSREVISKRTLAVLDQAMSNLSKGIAGPAIDPDDFEKFGRG